MVDKGGGDDEGEFKRSARDDIVRGGYEQAAPSERKSPNWGVLVSETLMIIQMIIPMIIPMIIQSIIKIIFNKSFTKSSKKMATIWSLIRPRPEK